MTSLYVSSPSNSLTRKVKTDLPSSTSFPYYSYLQEYANDNETIKIKIDKEYELLKSTTQQIITNSPKRKRQEGSCNIGKQK